MPLNFDTSAYIAVLIFMT